MTEARLKSSLSKWLAGTVTAGLLLLVGVCAPSSARLPFARLPAVAALQITLPKPTTSAPFESYADVVTRPLFNADRKPDPAASNVPGAQQVPTLDSYRLAGVVMAGTVQIALVERRATKTMVSLKIGDMLDGRTVKEIAPSRVVFDGPTAEVLEFPKLSGATLATTGSPSQGGPK